MPVTRDSGLEGNEFGIVLTLLEGYNSVSTESAAADVLESALMRMKEDGEISGFSFAITKK